MRIIDEKFAIRSPDTTWKSGSTDFVNLGLAGRVCALSGKWLTFQVLEDDQGEDLNGNGDTEDVLLHVRDLEAGETTNLGSTDGFDSVLFEDCYHVSPEWRDRYLASSMFQLRGSGGADNALVKRTRATLKS